MSIGKRIFDLRKNSNLTQSELASILNVTDKAISKWENNIGEPSYQLLIDISNYFKVSLDFLMTGKKDEKRMSLAEEIAKSDDLNLFIEKIHKSNVSLNNLDDLTNKNVLDYLLGYRSSKIIRFIIENSSYNQIRQNGSNSVIPNKYLEDFILFLLENKWFDLLTEKQGNKFGAPFIFMAIKDDEEKEILQSYFKIVNKSMASKIIKSKYIDDEVWSFMMGNGYEIYWSLGMPFLLEEAIIARHKKLGELVDFIEKANKHTMDMRKYYMDNEASIHINRYVLGYGGLFKGNEIKHSYTKITKKAVMNAINTEQFDLAERLNILSSKRYFSDYDMKMFKVNADKTMSAKDKIRNSVIVDDLIDIDKLIATGDYDMYEEMIELPATPYELGLYLIKNKEYEKLFKFAERYRLTRLRDAIIDGRTDLETYFKEEDLIQFGTINKKYYNKYQENNRQIRKQETNKYNIFFKDIKDSHKDIRFFEKAIQTNPEDMDSALESIVSKRGEDYLIQKLLLDNGAKIHSRWVEDDGWGYDILMDKVDDVATQLLKNQIKILMKEKDDKDARNHYSN